jgi:hypothetical protein
MAYHSAGCNDNPWVLLSIKDFCMPAMFDTGPSVSFVRQDVVEKIKKLGLLHMDETLPGG